MHSILFEMWWDGETQTVKLFVCKKKPIHSSLCRVFDMQLLGTYCTVHVQQLAGQGNMKKRRGRRKSKLSLFIHFTFSFSDVILFIFIQFSNHHRSKTSYTTVNTATVSSQLPLSFQFHHTFQSNHLILIYYFNNFFVTRPGWVLQQEKIGKEWKWWK